MTPVLLFVSVLRTGKASLSHHYKRQQSHAALLQLLPSRASALEILFLRWLQKLQCFVIVTRVIVLCILHVHLMKGCENLEISWMLKTVTES